MNQLISRAPVNTAISFPVLPTKRATRGRKRAKRVKWKSSKGIEK
jgi:hypothetical protein